MSTPLKKMIQHGGQYLFFQILILLLSLISFPVLTRLLTVEQYGNLALINVTILILLGLSKCGLGTAFIKYFPEYMENEQVIFSSSLSAAVAISSVIVCSYISILFLAKFVVYRHIFPLLWIVPAFIFFRSLQSLVMSWMRAEEKVMSCNLYSLANRLGVLIVGVSILLIFENRLLGFLVGCLASEGLLVVWVLMPYIKEKRVVIKGVSTLVAKQLVIYGLPLVAFELVSIAIAYADRYQIKYYLDSSSVGIYSAGYNLAMYVQQALTGPLWLAIFPIITKLWHFESKEKTTEFLDGLLKYYFCIAIFLLVVSVLISKEIIVLLASEKYIAAAEIVPFIITGTIVYGSYYIVGAALLLENQTSFLALSTAFCSLVNLLLNIYFVPHFGIIGAAYTTCMSYLMLIIIIYIKSSKIIKINWPFKDIAIYSLWAGIVMILSIITLDNLVFCLLVKGVLSVCIYGALILLYDMQLRRIVLNFLHQCFSQKFSSK